MNLLIVTPQLPYPLDSGGNAAQYLLIDYLRGHHAITLLCFSGKEAHYRALAEKWENVRVLVLPRAHAAGPKPALASRLYRRVKASLAVLATGKTGEAPAAPGGGAYPPRPGLPNVDLGRQGMFTRLPEGAPEFVLAEMQRKAYDLVQLEFVETLPLVYVLPPHVRKLFVHHEIRFVRMQRELATLPRPTLGDHISIEHAKWQEVHLLRRFDAVVTLSATDKQVLAGLMGEARIEVSPFPASFAPGGTGAYRFANKLVYVGGEAHQPNKDAVQWFLDEMWEALQRRQPGLRLYVTGNWRRETVQSYQSRRNVVFTGYVEDLGEVLAGAILVVPLRIGSGVRSKILDAIAGGIPVVSTTIGAEGLPLRHGTECLLADTAAGFVESLATLMRDAALGQTLIDNAKRAVAGGFSREECGQIRNRIYHTLTNHP